MDSKGAVLLGIATEEEFAEFLARSALEQKEEETTLPDNLWLGYL